ncbi:RDD family protein [Halosolutus halophilus]|uniref:RDD family protein n=1 Tax=Halosolutus halophilus TaxID=1552990 RepID=UPI0022351C9E|nr:RDD family protein [Halosolutus halophilus]
MSRRNIGRHDYAGLLERGIAWFVDGIALFVIAIVVLIPLLVTSGGPESARGIEGLAALFGLFLSTVYYAGSEAKWGQTPGKMLVRIRVVRTDGRGCTGAEAVLRNITKVLGGGAFLSVIVAIVLILATEENQRLGDLIGETIVVNV